MRKVLEKKTTQENTQSTNLSAERIIIDIARKENLTLFLIWRRNLTILSALVACHDRKHCLPIHKGEQSLKFYSHNTAELNHFLYAIF